MTAPRKPFSAGPGLSPKKKKPGLKPPTSKVKPPKFQSDAIAEKMLDAGPGA